METKRYIPSESELLEMGFGLNKYKNYQLIISEKPFDIIVTSYDWTLFIEISEHCRKIYPESREKLEFFISMLTYK